MKSIALDVTEGGDSTLRSSESRLIEFGHFYRVKGPTAWSRMGHSVAERIKRPQDKTLLFVDDIHTIGDVNQLERDLPVISFNPPHDFHIMESAMVGMAFEALGKLTSLSRRSRARFNGDGVKKWHCSGLALTHGDGSPTCTLLDVGLTLHKTEVMGFGSVINVLPEFYEGQQRGVLRLVQKILPELRMDVILFSEEGAFRRIAV